LVGYTGGTSENPTYHNLGDHTETLQITYDPAQITYEKLLDMFWKSHSPTDQPWSKQYMSILLYHNEDQKRSALQTKDHEESKHNSKIHTEIVPASTFYLAEMYHQKYYLQQEEPELIRELLDVYSTFEEFNASTLAARLNGYVAGVGTIESIKNELSDSNVSPEGQQKLMDYLSRI
jgi:peptide-methionine (S)-S-oxide reductase